MTSKNILGHHFTGAAPRGVNVYKDLLSFRPGFLKCFLIGAMKKFNALRIYTPHSQDPKIQ